MADASTDQPPRDDSLDLALAIFREGNPVLWNRFQRLNTDLFVTRLGGQRAVCIHGTEAVRLFYDEAKFQRSGAIPRRVVTSLFGKHAVHTLDDEARRHRKMAFLSLMTNASLARLMHRTADEWRAAIRRWEAMPRVVLFDEVAQLLTRSICGWAGVPLNDEVVSLRAGELIRMVDAFGGAGPRLWRGKIARMRAQRWITRLIESVRRGETAAEAGTALHVMAHHRGLNGELLDAKTAAVELLNVIRPTVAISWYVTFAALALHQNPETRERFVADANDGESAGPYADWFMNEVRRFYPFAPFLGAMVRHDFHWHGHHFEAGNLVLIDIYGLHHDPAIWGDADVFRPERFRDWTDDAFNFIPQGGGGHASGHRCPGEWITMHNLTLAQHFLTRCVTYDVAPDQDLSFDLRRMPTRPADGFIIENVRATPRLNEPAPRLPSWSATRGAPSALATAGIGQ